MPYFTRYWYLIRHGRQCFGGSLEGKNALLRMYVCTRYDREVIMYIYLVYLYNTSMCLEQQQKVINYRFREMWVPGSRPNRGMDIVQRRSHHSPRSWISVSYCTTVVTHIPGLLVVVSSDMPRDNLSIIAQRNARLVPRTHTISSPSSLMVVLVGSSVPILCQNLACPPRYPLRKEKCCRCRVEPGVLPTFGVDGRTPHRKTSSTWYISYEVRIYVELLTASYSTWTLGHSTEYFCKSNSRSPRLSITWYIGCVCDLQHYVGLETI